MEVLNDLDVHVQYILPRMRSSRPKISFFHRYGLEGWVCCGGHAVPEIIQMLSKEHEIHFYGPHTTESRDDALRANLTVHELPYTWNRANPNDKINKTILWYFWLPIIGLRCRLNGTRLIWNDETVPLTALILRLFYGKNVAITVMDFFMRIYTEGHPRLHWLRDVVERVDFASWRKLPLIFTKVLYTQEFLAKKGVPKEIMHLYRNPVDHSKFHPVDEEVRKSTREQFGFTDDDIVLSHHGILHPNKGNDWILKRLAELKDDLPKLKFLLIGNGPEMENLQQLAKKLQLSDRVVFAGWLPSEEDLNNALASSDIGLAMRIGQETDHFHMTDTLAHEMACGKPILAVSLCGIAEVIESGKTGYLFSSNAPETFSSSIKELSLNRALRSELANASLEKSRKLCTIQTCSKNISSILETVANANKPEPHDT